MQNTKKVQGEETECKKKDKSSGTNHALKKDESSGTYHESNACRIHDGAHLLNRLPRKQVQQTKEERTQGGESKEV